MHKEQLFKEICNRYIKIGDEDILFKYDGKFFLVLNNKNVEVSKEIFENYKHLCWKFEYNEEKYSNSISLDTYGYTDHFEYICLDGKALEDIIMDRLIVEKIKNIANKHQNGLYIIKKLLQGYHDTEIAEEIGISRQLFSYQKKILFKEIKKEIKEDYL